MIVLTQTQPPYRGEGLQAGEKVEKHAGHTKGEEPITSASKFEVNVRINDAVVSVCVSGEVDMATAEQMADSIATACKGGGHEVVVDLRDVTFMDCSGVRVIINARKTADEDGTHLSFLPSAWVVRVLDLLELEQLLQHPSG